MIYDTYFETALARLKDERRYRVFADLERLAGRFPHAIVLLAGSVGDVGRLLRYGTAKFFTAHRRKQYA